MMRRVRFGRSSAVLAAIAAATLFVGGVSQATSLAPGGQSEGAELYKAECQPCHGAGGQGDGPAARFMDSKPRDLTSPEWMYARDRTLEQVIEVVTAGVDDTGMEPFGEILTAEEISAVAAYVLQQFVATDS